jgi:ribosomal protein S18 acetylase RimI-like enzyme
LTLAFDDDPVTKFCVRTDGLRHSAMQAGFRRALDVYHPFGLTFVLNDGVGVALWARHDQWRLTLWQEFSLVPLYIHVCGINRFMRLVRGVEVLESHHPADLHYYLYMLAVRPEHQSQGLGSALLRTMLERCDREQMPAYLEASNPRNISLYQRHGFRVRRELQFGPGGPLLRAMWREPRQGG